ncbi:MAG: hypothetical protein L0312_26405, partial [Acidobacteria bacterium]|nr:hypothetical protein [Acidobacteriota bacterium]
SMLNRRTFIASATISPLMADAGRSQFSSGARSGLKPTGRPLVISRGNGKGNPPQLNFYALNKKGESGAASIYKGAKYCLHDGAQSYQLDSAWLLEKKPT